MAKKPTKLSTETPAPEVQEVQEVAPTSLETPDPAPAPSLADLTEAFEKLATLTGNANMLYDFNMKPWQPGRKDMSRHPASE